MARVAHGSTIKNFAPSQVGEFEIVLPAIEKQPMIADVLGNLDNKIMVNDKIIKISEEFMRELYNYWFVQFDFPDENGRPYKTSGGKMVYNEMLKREIPRGWEVKELGEIIIESKKSTIQVNEARNQAGTYPFFTSGDEIISFKDYYIDGFNIFLNTGGNADVKTYYGKAAYSTDTWCISAKEYSFMLAIFLGNIKEYLNDNCFAGSGLKHLQKDAFKQIKIVIPNSKITEAFNSIVGNYFKDKSKRQIENKKLAALRDWLLPMLMNGQIKVSD
jgi:type I restriction enzyme S subunit